MGPRAQYRYSSVGLLRLSPPIADTLTGTVPLPGGVRSVISEEETTCTEVAKRRPKRTRTAPSKWLPQIVTFVPPIVGPWAGRISSTLGAGTNVNLVVGLTRLEPPTADTTTKAAPEPDGTATLIRDDEIRRKIFARLAPKRTETEPRKLWPWIVTVVPPLLGPSGGVILVMVGGQQTGSGSRSQCSTRRR